MRCGVRKILFCVARLPNANCLTVICRMNVQLFVRFLFFSIYISFDDGRENDKIEKLAPELVAPLRTF